MSDPRGDIILPIVWDILNLPDNIQPRQLDRLLEDSEDTVIVRHLKQPDHPTIRHRLYLYPTEWADRQHIEARCRNTFARLGVRVKTEQTILRIPGLKQFFIPFIPLCSGTVSLVFLLPILLEYYGQPWVIPAPYPALLSLVAVLCCGFSLPIAHRAPVPGIQLQTVTMLFLVSLLVLLARVLLPEAIIHHIHLPEYDIISWIAAFTAIATIAVSMRQPGKTRQVTVPKLPSVSDHYTVLQSGHALQVPTPLLQPGDIIRLLSGETVPAEGTIVEGNALISGNDVAVHAGIGCYVPPMRQLREGMISLQLLQTADAQMIGKIYRKFDRLWFSIRPEKKLSLRLLALLAAIGTMATMIQVTPIAYSMISCLLLSSLTAGTRKSRRLFQQCLHMLAQHQLLPPDRRSIRQAGQVSRFIIHEQAFHVSTPWQVEAIIPVDGDAEQVLRLAASLHQGTPLSLTAPLSESARKERLRLLPVTEQQCLPTAGYLRGVVSGMLLICVPETQLQAEGFHVPELAENLPDGERFFLADAGERRILGCIITSHAAMTSQSLAVQEFQQLAIEVWVVRYASPDQAIKLDISMGDESHRKSLVSILAEPVPTLMLSNQKTETLPEHILQCHLCHAQDIHPLPQGWCLLEGNLARLADALSHLKTYDRTARKMEHQKLGSLTIASSLILWLQPPLPVIAAGVLAYQLVQTLQHHSDTE